MKWNLLTVTEFPMSFQKLRIIQDSVPGTSLDHFTPIFQGHEESRGKNCSSILNSQLLTPFRWNTLICGFQGLSRGVSFSYEHLISILFLWPEGIS
ncbi:hypothetical protein CEXT_84791 [Caerostris extrusa]|uniref:Uncharacterized protein n=1 Tax=Caerostris extrusa TaxID=172846 RepID=A0AAV4RLP8_CAEEX|nr:hypothetical protein CEXT_84791 [Caerostris extrusa]